MIMDRTNSSPVATMNEDISSAAQVVLAGGLLDREAIDSVVLQSSEHLWDLLYWANRIRIANFGNSIKVCSIVPGRLGGCSQDCRFCSQSARYKTAVEGPAVFSDEEILSAAAKAKQSGVGNLGIVYSGRAVDDDELERVERLVGQIRNDYGLEVCASLGTITADQAHRLARAGVSKYNHNLETSERHFGNVVGTHEYTDRVATIRAVRAAGLGICAGGIFGIGESDSDRVDMAIELRGLEADTVPMNFLHPIEGTPMGDFETMAPMEVLRVIAIYRFILPTTNLKVAGGRSLNLRDMQSWIFYAGATGILSGDYLTTAGRAVVADMQMLKDLGLEAQA